jgi:RNA polymerase nonessential primary-like sigma factor
MSPPAKMMLHESMTIQPLDIAPDLCNDLPPDVLTALPPEQASLSDPEFWQLLASNEHTLTDLQHYMRDIGFKPLLSYAEEIDLAKKIIAGDQKARERMIESNLRLVVKISRRYINRGITLLDLIEEGNLGLMHAIKKFDPDKGFRFSTYATWWIRQSIERIVVNANRAVRVPVHRMKQLNACLRKTRDLTQILGRDPTTNEVSSYVNQSQTEVKKLLDIHKERTLSTDTPIGDTGSQSLGDLLSDAHRTEPSTNLIQEDFEGNMEQWFARLEPMHQQVLKMRYGLCGHHQHTLDNISQSLNISKDRARKLQTDALTVLRKILMANGFTSSCFEYT